MSESPQFTPLPGQNADGVDVTLILENLKLSPAQRLRKADRAARDAERMRRYRSQVMERVLGPNWATKLERPGHG